MKNKGEVRMIRRKLEDLNLLDDFLFQQLVSRGEDGENFCRILLETILGKKIGRVKVAAQKAIPGRDTDLHGIRLDAFIEAVEPETDVEVESEIYDIEPNRNVERKALPKRTRYYQGLIDSRLLDSNMDYRKLKNVVIIMILPYDPFGDNRMVYTVQNQCVENPNLPYDDGTKKIYLYTKGIEGTPSQELQEMLKYMENSIAENVTNQNIEAIHNYVKRVKDDKEVGIQYMKSWEWEQLIEERATAEGMAKGMEKGMEKGRQEKAIEIAKQLLGILDVPTIAEKTGLSEETVKKLEEESIKR